MAVYKRGYKRYLGELEGRRRRFLALPRYAFRRMFRQRMAVMVLCASLCGPLVAAAYIYLANNMELLRMFEGGIREFLSIDGDFFLTFITAQKVFAVFLAALIGPGLISPDLTDNALPLYFSRPLSRIDYAAGRLAAPVALLSLITWIPGLMLFLFQASAAGDGWGAANWRICLSIVAGLGLWILLCALVALVSSAYVKLRAVAGGLTLGFFFILSGGASMINGVFRATGGSLLNPSWSVQRLCRAVMGTETAFDEPGAAAALMSVAAFLLLLMLVLERKLRPVEVVA